MNRINFFKNPTGGAEIGEPGTAEVTIMDYTCEPQPASLQFSSPAYSVDEDNVTVKITVIRWNGNLCGVVSA
ncbi:MAG: hypothetical protein ABFS56_29610 [Pseudomonadota bacterium]